MAPQTHTRYRVQRLIRLGEWLERNEPALITAFDAINEAHNALLDADAEDAPSPNELLERITFDQMYPLMSLEKLMMELRHNIPTKNISFGADVTIHQPYACLKHQWEVVIEAPQANVPTQKQYDLEEQERLKAEYDAAQAAAELEPTQEEFDKVRSEVDGI